MNMLKSTSSLCVSIICLLLVLKITGKVLTFKTVGLAILVAAALLSAGFGIYCLVEWIKEKKKKQV